MLERSSQLVANQAPGVPDGGHGSLINSSPLSISFLKALSGRLERVSTLRQKGEIKYNGHTFDEFSVVRTAGFVEQARGLSMRAADSDR